jgi:hypothetical protein
VSGLQQLLSDGVRIELRLVGQVPAEAFLRYRNFI